MSCANCEDIANVDGVMPECETGECPMPQLTPGAERLLDVWSLLKGLGDLVDRRSVHEMYGVTKRDLQSFLFIEDEIKKLQEVPGG